MRLTYYFVDDKRSTRKASADTGSPALASDVSSYLFWLTTWAFFADALGRPPRLSSIRPERRLFISRRRGTPRCPLRPLAPASDWARSYPQDPTAHHVRIHPVQLPIPC